MSQLPAAGSGPIRRAPSSCTERCRTDFVQPSTKRRARKMTPTRTNAFETPTNVGDGYHRPTIGATSTGRFHCGVCGTATPIGEVHKCELTRRQRRAVEAQKAAMDRKLREAATGCSPALPATRRCPQPTPGRTSARRRWNHGECGLPAHRGRLQARPWEVAPCKSAAQRLVRRGSSARSCHRWQRVMEDAVLRARRDGQQIDDELPQVIPGGRARRGHGVPADTDAD